MEDSKKERYDGTNFKAWHERYVAAITKRDWEVALEVRPGGRGDANAAAQELWDKSNRKARAELVER